MLIAFIYSIVDELIPMVQHKNHTRRHDHQPQMYKTNTPYILKQSLNGSRQGLNPGPFVVTHFAI